MTSVTVGITMKRRKVPGRTTWEWDTHVDNSPSPLWISCWSRCPLLNWFTDSPTEDDAISWATTTSAVNVSAVRRNDVTGSDVATITTTKRTRLRRWQWLQSCAASSRLQVRVRSKIAMSAAAAAPIAAADEAPATVRPMWKHRWQLYIAERSISWLLKGHTRFRKCGKLHCK